MAHRPGTTRAARQRHLDVVMDCGGHGPSAAVLSAGPSRLARTRVLGFVGPAEGSGLPGGLALGSSQLFFQFHDASVLGAQLCTHTFQFVLPDLVLLAEGLMPALNGAKSAARNDLRQIGIALNAYVTDNAAYSLLAATTWIVVVFSSFKSWPLNFNAASSVSLRSPDLASGAVSTTSFPAL